MEPSSNQEASYPHGFYAAEAVENVKHCFQYNNNPEQEMNFNDFVYFHSQNGKLTCHVVEYDILRKIVANPKQEQHRMDKMMMVNEEGQIFPAHLPNMADVVNKPEVQSAISDIEKGESVTYEGKTKIIPTFMVDKIDPKPILPRTGPIYSLRLNGFTTEFGSYTDDVIFLQVKSPMTEISYSVFRDQFIEDNLTSRYQSVKLRPEVEPNKREINIGASVVLWNGRRISRPSFVEHFKEIVDIHNLMIMIVIEVGATSINCERILSKLDTTLSWHFDAGGGILRGTIVFWDSNRVDSTMLIATDEDNDNRIMGTFNAVQV
ncbi:uncharacterized protein LOC110720084 [Chenopodium quinoa]|uniref:uncharacterized protein LOC110720084 n=1 Tax=Chenopodium quinoa TaxID=63459 RepID=UPI000B7817B1|nr:uncharacterized protein LOC110720084 [Chenopodium quinoa]